MNKPTVYFIYDTSYLMLSSRLDVPLALKRRSVHVPTDPEKKERFFGNTIYPPYSHPILNFMEFRCCVPHQVEEELKEHFNDELKGPLAKVARKIIARLFEDGAERIQLPKDTSNLPKDRPLSADSKTDKGIMSWALEKAANDKTYAIILTDDGGILYDIVDISKITPRIFCYTKERDSQLDSFILNIVKNTIAPDYSPDWTWLWERATFI